MDNELVSVPGLAFRRFGGAPDLPSIAAVMNASLAADLSGEHITAEGLANTFANPDHWDPLQDALLAEMNGTLVGYASTEWHEEAGGTCLHFIDLYLVSEWRGCGIEMAMQRTMESRARAATTVGSEGTRRCFASKVPATWQSRIDLLIAEGYAPARYYLEMQRSLEGDLPAVSLPSGIEFRPALPEHYRAIWQADEECDRDNWGHVALSEESYRAWVQTPDLDPSLWCVAWQGDQVAGAAINVVYQGTWGETDDLFVRRPWRGQGLGRALLVGSLHLFKARRLTTAGLGVDAENLSGALRLYESVGYHPYQRTVSYRKWM